MVNFGGVAVPGSPFHVLNDNPNDPSLVKVYGPGIEKGVCAGKPVDFTVDCTKSGPGHVNVNITSSKRKTVPVSIVDNKSSNEIDGKVHPSLDTFGHNGVFEVASIEEPVITWGLKFFKKGLAKLKII